MNYVSSEKELNEDVQNCIKGKNQIVVTLNGYYDSQPAYSLEDKLSYIFSDVLQDYDDMFLGYAKLHPELEFLLTRIGCGLAGYSDKEIAPLFKNDILPNIIYPKEWNFTSYSV